MTPLTIRLGDRAVAARIDAGNVVIDDTTFTVTSAGPGEYVVDDGRRRWRVAVADAGDERWISVDGRVAVVEVESGAAARAPRKKTAAADSMMAPMPATVVKLLVEPGRAVTEGATIIVLEAMKMELAIRAPRDGVVRAVHCTQGELVQPGVALVELE